MIHFLFFVIHGYLLISRSLLVSCTSSSSPSSDSLTTIESSESVDATQRFDECKTIFEQHGEGYHFSGVQERLSSIKAIEYAAGVISNFNEVLFDESLSVPFHCFLLNYFLIVNEEVYEAGKQTSYVSDFIQFYSEHLARKVEYLQDVSIVKRHVIPLINELVFTGNYLHYSLLLSVCIDSFNQLEKNFLYVSHGTQFAFRLRSNFEIFKMGIEFLQLYAPRYELLSVSGIQNMKEFASNHQQAFYLLAFNPLKAVLSSKPRFFVILPLVVYEEVQCLIYLDAFLAETRYLDFATETMKSERKSVFNSLLSDILTPKNILTAVKLNLYSVFKAWIQFYRTILDNRSIARLRKACYKSLDVRFREAFDSLFRINQRSLRYLI